MLDMGHEDRWMGFYLVDVYTLFLRCLGKPQPKNMLFFLPLHTTYNISSKSIGREPVASMKGSCLVLVIE
jgi:hypothetical protein